MRPIPRLHVAVSYWQKDDARGCKHKTQSRPLKQGTGVTSAKICPSRTTTNKVSALRALPLLRPSPTSKSSALPPPRLSGMDSEVVVEKMQPELDSSSDGHLCSKKTRILETKDAESSEAASGANLAPVTPVVDRGNREALAGSDTPITWVASPAAVVTSSSDGTETGDNNSGVRTPKRRVFDPFAPGPDELMFAPRKKPLEESRARTIRRLNFESCSDFMEGEGENDLEDMHEENILESVYESFLDAIVSKQAEGILAENPSLGLGIHDGFKTPTSSPLLNGVAETCPGAPMKPMAKVRSFIGVGICRKLEF